MNSTQDCSTARRVVSSWRWHGEVNEQPASVAALRYREEFNWDVRPAALRGKLPIVPWSLKRTPLPLSLDELSEFWADDPLLNIAVLTGSRSGIVVADIDPRHGGTLDVLWQMGWSEDTCIARTGGGGWHVYGACPAEGLRSVDSYATGIEFKADGKLVIAPSSVSSKGSYEWLPERDPWTLAPAELSAHVLAELGARRVVVASEPVELSKKHRRRLPRVAVRFVRRAIERARDGRDGGRHNSGLWLACQLRDLRVSDEIGERCMLAYQREVEAAYV